MSSCSGVRVISKRTESTGESAQNEQRNFQQSSVTHHTRRSSLELNPLQAVLVGDIGFEDVQETAGNHATPVSGGAECGAVDAGWHLLGASADSELQELIDAWRSMPAPMRAAVVALVRAAIHTL